MARDRLIIFFDGGCRPGPVRLETAVVVRGVASVWDEDVQGDSADAEWLALIRGVRAAVAAGAEDVVLVGDSALVIHQARGEWACRREGLAVHRTAFLALAAQVPRLRLRHVRRAKNLAGIALARRRL